MKSPKSPNKVKIRKSGCNAVSFAVTQAIAPQRGANQRIKATTKIKTATAINAATSIGPVALSQAGIANKGDVAAEVQSNALRAVVIIVKLLKIQKVRKKGAVPNAEEPTALAARFETSQTTLKRLVIFYCQNAILARSETIANA